ncbi:MAG: hypothetical protein IKJ83_01290 [Ruminococcus sp.]|nr:hypothetical protein [Ruminococcus sp.]
MESVEKTKQISRLVYSVVSLVLLLTLLITATHAWMSNNLTSKIDSSNEYITIDADAGLEMNYGQEDVEQGVITINDKIVLHECSSADGKNFFFPLSDYAPDIDYAREEGIDTYDYVYREGTVLDKNTKYISIDLSLESKTETDVWLSANTGFKESPDDTSEASAAANAIRIAVIDNSPNGKSIIFDNNMTGYENLKKYEPISRISEDGFPETVEVIPNAFIDYAFDNQAGEDASKNVLFHMDPGIEKDITVNIWLEGTDPDCDNDVVGVEDLDIYIKFSTSFENERTFTFVDHTLEEWVGNDGSYVFAIDQDGEQRRMDPSRENVWTIALAESTSSLRFARYNPNVQGGEWNYWEAGEVGECSTYNAIGHSAGIWDDSFSGTTITLLDGTPNGYLRYEDAEMHLMFNLKDGNGVTQSFDYKISYQNENYRWQITIPTAATDISFKRMDKTQTTQYGDTWTVGSRGNNQYITLNTASSGYWSNQLLYIEDDGNIKGSDAVFATCFYTSGSDHTWTAMRAHFTTSDGKFRYVAAIPEGKTKCNITRYKSTAEYWGWDWNTTVFNQTPDYTGGFATINFYKTKTWESNNSVIQGTWYHTDTTWKTN